ncbi:MAG: glycoside hydrolase family 5 protein [Ktedonobacteraceae bacterium]
MRRTNLLLLGVIGILVLVIAGVGIFIVAQLQNQGSTGSNQQATATPSGGTPTSTFTVPASMPHVQGAQIVDAHGNPLILRGAQIETSLNYIKSWDSGERPTATLNSTVFHVMAQDWKMNAMRLPLSNWIYAKDTATYTSQLDQIVQEANAAGLYVVLDLHDNQQAGSPYSSKSADLPKTEDIAFWKAIAAHFKNNPMVMFDLYNEPNEPNWQTWLHGGGTIGGATTVGFQDLINAVRSVGAQQIIVVEPGSAGKTKNFGQDTAEESGWATFGNTTLNDPDIVYSLHVYEGITASPQQLDANWGPILNHHPIYYGEWAFLPNSSTAAHCKNLPTNPASANQVVINFLNYMSSHNASWTAWQFAPHFLVQNYSSFSPTTLDNGFTCGDTKQYNVGMGAIVKQYLTTGHA